MAWCPHCQEDRPITRQTYNGPCTICKKGYSSLGTAIDHKAGCRGAVPGAFDVCAHCNEQLFSKARSQEEFIQLHNAERNMPKTACFVVTATMGDDQCSVVQELRCFRDNTLIKSKIGQAFSAWYYRNGPKFAAAISASRLNRILSFALIVLPAYSIAFVVNRFARR